MTRRSMVFACLVLSVFMVTPLEAQRGPPMGRRGQGQGQERAQLERRVRAQMGEMMQRRLGLTVEESKRLGEMAQEFEPQRRALARREQAVRLRVEALMMEQSADEAEAIELLDQLTEIRRQDVELFVREQEQMLEVLTPVQVLSYQALREQLGERIRRLRGGQRGRGDSGGNGPPGRDRRDGGLSER